MEIKGRLTHNWHDRHLQSRTTAQYIADVAAAFIGSWPFIITQALLVIVWVALNLMAYAYRWDPYPFILLNLMFSTQAAFTGPVIMMAQNRQSERDREQAVADFETNIAAKEEIEDIQKSLARIENERLDRILQLLEDMRTKK